MPAETTALDAGLLKAVRITCFTCWKASHKPPPATALYLMDDYKWEMGCALRLQEDALRVAHDAGYSGNSNDLLYLAHREAFAAGDESQLEAMLRHVRLDG